MPASRCFALAASGGRGPRLGRARLERRPHGAGGPAAQLAGRRSGRRRWRRRPEDFHAESARGKKLLEDRRARVGARRGADWVPRSCCRVRAACAGGTAVRVRARTPVRGTFGHRHGRHLRRRKGFFSALRHGCAAQPRSGRARRLLEPSTSPLSEAGPVLGLRVRAVRSGRTRAGFMIWEATVRRLVETGGKVIIDQFIRGAANPRAAYWEGGARAAAAGTATEGQGSGATRSARLERFLQLCRRSANMAGDRATDAGEDLSHRGGGRQDSTGDAGKPHSW